MKQQQESKNRIKWNINVCFQSRIFLIARQALQKTHVYSDVCIHLAATYLYSAQPTDTYNIYLFPLCLSFGIGGSGGDGVGSILLPYMH